MLNKLCFFIIVTSSLFAQKNKTLDLSRHNLDSLCLPTMDVSRVKNLILNQISVTKFPKELLKFQKLKRLQLQNVDSLSRTIVLEYMTQFPQLEYIDLSHNDFVQIPKSIGSIKTLTTLRLSYNRMDIQASLAVLNQLPKLCWLYIDNNGLKKLPKSLFNLPVTYLYAYANEISTLEFPKTKNKALWVLHLGENNFDILPEALTQKKGLRMAMFNGNKIKRIPKVFEKHNFSLMAITLDDNPLGQEEVQKAKKYFKEYLMFSY